MKKRFWSLGLIFTLIISVVLSPIANVSAAESSGVEVPQSVAPATMPAQKNMVTTKLTGNNSFDIVLSNINAPNGIKSISFPVWAAENGQDNVVWYPAIKQPDGTYKASVSIANHKYIRGVYYIHGYLTGFNDVQTNIFSTSIEIPNMQAKISAKLLTSNSFEVIVSDVVAPNGVKSIQVPVWSNINGGDDLIWYTATKQADGTYKTVVNISNHKYDRGNYTIHSYGTDNNDWKVGINSTSIEIPNMQAKISTKLLTSNSFEVIVSDVVAPNGVKSIQVPVWSESNGGDDLIWYTATKQADGTYKTVVNISNHKYDRGNYIIHSYGTDNNDWKVGVNSTSITIPQMKMTIKASLVTNNSFEIIFSDIEAPNGVKNISVPVWSESEGQDDLMWYTAIKQADGTYRVRVDISKHKYNRGVYIIHAYGVDNNDYSIGLVSTSIEIPNLTATLTATQINQNEFEIVAKDVVAPNGVKKINVATWSSYNGGDDLIWYELEKQADGTYKKIVNIKDHKYVSGEYILHGYATDISNYEKFYAKATINISRVSEVTTTAVQTGPQTFSVTISNLLDAKGIKSIKVPVWSDYNGQDDLVWYTATQQLDGTYKANVNIGSHKNTTGGYTIHTYLEHLDGSSESISSTPLNMVKKENVNYNIVENASGFYITLKGLTSDTGINQVRFVVWSEAYGADDLVWYTATRQVDGTFTANVNLKDHLYFKGKYNIHVYVTEGGSEEAGFDNKTFNVTGGNTGVASGKINPHTMADPNYLGVIAYDLSDLQGISKVEFAVWSDANGSDVKYYEAIRDAETGAYGKAINLADYNYAKGTYYIHLYITTKYTNQRYSINSGSIILNPEGERFIWPTNGIVTSKYGNRTYTINGVVVSDFHLGIDIGAGGGSPIVASKSGTVEYAGWNGTYGNCVIINHGGGVTTRYAHASSYVVSPGQYVSQGQLIARVGSTGNSSGNHLHFEIRINNQTVNPLDYL